MVDRAYPDFSSVAGWLVDLCQQLRACSVYLQFVLAKGDRRLCCRGKGRRRQCRAKVEEPSAEYSGPKPGNPNREFADWRSFFERALADPECASVQRSNRAASARPE